jgi:anti-sigma factor RsiW
MNAENHERARKLMKAALVEGIGAGEHEWLNDHLAVCPECAKEARAFAAAIQSLHALPIVAGAELVHQTRLAVRSRAAQLQAARARSTPLWIAAAMSSVFMILTAPYVWQAFTWVGRMAQIPGAVLEVGFLMWWFLPATVVAAAAAWRRAAIDGDSDWVTESSWRQR